MPTLIDGKKFAATLRGHIAAQIAEIKAAHGVPPGLATILVGDDPASDVYVRNKARQTQEAGMLSFAHKLPSDTCEGELLTLITRMCTENLNPDVVMVKSTKYRV